LQIIYKGLIPDAGSTAGIIEGKIMFTPLEKKQILKLNQRLSHDITIGLVASRHTSSKLFHEFCEDIIRLVPKIKISKLAADPQDPPQIRIGSGLRYQAIPSGYELQPFLEALAAFESNSLKIADSVKILLKKNKLPASLTIFIAPQCTFCPQMVQKLNTLSMADENLQLTVVDGTLFPEMVQTHGIRSVPTILLDDQFRWSGSVSLEELIDTINTRDPISLSPASLEGIIKEGGAGRLAAMMLEAEKLFPAFYDVLTHEKWPIRLGAMVVMEEIAGINPDLAAEALSPLWDRFHEAPPHIQGDILHVFGEIGDPRSVSWLETVLSGNFDQEVQEAAREAAVKITNTDA
jgi:glutaredoxin